MPFLRAGLGVGWDSPLTAYRQPIAKVLPVKMTGSLLVFFCLRSAEHQTPSKGGPTEHQTTTHFINLYFCYTSGGATEHQRRHSGAPAAGVCAACVRAQVTAKSLYFGRVGLVGEGRLTD